MNTSLTALTVALAAALTGNGGAQARGTGFAPGTGTLRVHAPPFTVPTDARSPLLSNLLLVREGAAPVYYLSTGLGVPHGFMKMQSRVRAAATALRQAADFSRRHHPF